MLKEKFLGAMVGCGLGDAIGELAFGFFDRVELRSRVSALETLVYTDDTAMTLGLAESLIKAGGLEPQHLGARFHANFMREPSRGYGPGPPSLFARVLVERIPYVDAARGLYGSQGSFGNGGAMRTAPIGLVYRDTPELYDNACIAASVTHAHPIGMDGAAVQAVAVAEAVRRDPGDEFTPDEFAQVLVDTARTEEVRAKMTLVRELCCRQRPPQEAAERIGRSLAVHESMPFAIFAFLTHPDSFEDCLACAVGNGGDCDTLGAMACAVSGAYLGIDAIPAAWRDKLENRVYIENLALKLAAMTVQ